MNQIKEQESFLPGDLTSEQTDALIRDVFTSNGSIELTWTPTYGISTAIFPHEIARMREATDEEREAYFASVNFALLDAECITVFSPLERTHPV